MTGKVLFAAFKTAKAFCALCLIALIGCDAGRYNVILAVDAKEYHPTMTWAEIRESGFKKSLGMRVFDANGHPVPLFRFMHESRNIMPLDETEIHFSTPIIVEKKYARISVVVLDREQTITNAHVTIRTLNSVSGGPKAYAAPIEIPTKR